MAYSLQLFTMKGTKMPKQTFEKSIQQLEEIVQELESGDLPLEKAIHRFEEGMNSFQALFQNAGRNRKKNLRTYSGNRRHAVRKTLSHRRIRIED